MASKKQASPLRFPLGKAYSSLMKSSIQSKAVVPLQRPRNQTPNHGIDQDTKDLDKTHAINEATIPNFFYRATFRVGSWFTTMEDRLFAASQVYRIYETESAPSSEKAIKAAREFDEIASLARKECQPLWPHILFGLVIIPHLCTIIGVATLTLMLEEVIWENEDPPYGILFYGTVAVVLMGIYLSKVALDDVNPKRYNRVIPRWHQLFTVLETMAISLIISMIESGGLAMLIICFMETGYLIGLLLFLYWLPMDSEKTLSFPL